MNLWTFRLASAVFFSTALFAQPQIGGGQCASSSLSGTYSLTLTGRDVNSSLAFTNVLQGVGQATFDGLSKVTLSFTQNTNKAAGTAENWSGTYSLQSNCLGVLTITSGDAVTFTLGSYASGTDYFIAGGDGTYQFTGSGSTTPTTCTASLLNGTYAFNGNGFNLNSATITGANDILGLLTFDGVKNVTSNWYVAMTGSNANDTGIGTFAVNSNCTANATVTDTAGKTYTLQFVITAAKGQNFLITGASASLLFVGSGRIL
jgi:hypothetical protein